MESKLNALVRSYFKKKGLPLQPALTFADVVIKDNFSEIGSRSDISNLKTKLVRNIYLNIPIVSANMDTVTDARMAIALAKLGGLGFIHQFFSLEERMSQVSKVKNFSEDLKGFNASTDPVGRLLVGVAIRLNSDYLKEIEGLLGAEVDVILLDTARANSKRVQEAVRKIKSQFPDIPLVVGNIDTSEAAEMLIKAGADCLKVGIGPGSACKTREATGVGIPQITAVASCAAVARKYGVPIIADGGIKGGADLSKALVAGANSVMIGSLFAGTAESPGDLIDGEGKLLYKLYRGSASKEHQIDRVSSGSLDKVRHSEGVSRRVLYTGSINLVIDELLGGLRSSMSYVGARDLDEFWKLGKFVWQTNSGYVEGKPQI